MHCLYQPSLSEKGTPKLLVFGYGDAACAAYEVDKLTAASARMRESRDIRLSASDWSFVQIQLGIIVDLITSFTMKQVSCHND
jgi:hypothetical protein